MSAGPVLDSELPLCHSERSEDFARQAGAVELGRLRTRMSAGPVLNSELPLCHSERSEESREIPERIERPKVK
jgi:hypothetical protein